MRWEGTSYMWGKRKTYMGFWCGNLQEADQLEELGKNGRISKWILEK